MAGQVQAVLSMGHALLDLCSTLQASFINYQSGTGLFSALLVRWFSFPGDKGGYG